MKDYYVILQVSRSATLQEIKVAYKNFALKLHPDVTGNNEDKTRIFKQLTEAYNILSDQDARQKYDSKLGISRVSTFYRPGGSHPGGEGDIRAPRPPPDFKIFDHDEWNAWHYGEGEGVHKEPFVKRRNPFMDIRPDNKGAQFFVRQKTKETQSVIDQSYKRGKAEKDLIVERMKARRAARMANRGYNEDSASAGGSCVIA
ncbi:hypothetical protein NSK_002588 [Nannochloropsis salina CCMP1776]|uniref:Chaperone protein n=2 Tax=Monodopsidaceae TaxID=425072 RepID=W7TYU3_9STRA|nr:chaperone protein [Nannochloropsis gaditana]TFJ86380.1 hypothetical protein NSK_002588 [Nannochloropsis salina CCMP1776]|eukprot:TFJ86380.1 hypothetical protein NSK_002588 [Nannochloropsis salina CCMP1776]